MKVIVRHFTGGKSGRDFTETDISDMFDIRIGDIAVTLRKGILTVSNVEGILLVQPIAANTVELHPKAWG